MRFPFAPRATRPLNGLAEINGNDVTFPRVRAGRDRLHRARRVRRDAADYDFRVENRRTGAGVRITGDRPMSKLLFWSAWKTSCPEPYIDMRVAPGKEFTWEIPTSSTK